MRVIIWIKIGLIGFLLLIIINVSRDIVSLLKAENRLEKAKQHLSEVKAENIKAKLLGQQLLGKDFLEQQARDKLGMAKPDEVVVILPDDLKTFQDYNEPKTDGGKYQEPWRQWLAIFW